MSDVPAGGLQRIGIPFSRLVARLRFSKIKQAIIKSK